MNEGTMMKTALALAGLGLLTACSVGPDYETPTMDIPAVYKEAKAQDGWKQGQPLDHMDRGAWWAVYDDPVLDALARQVEVSNQTLKASEAAYRQAVAVIQAARASYFPTLTFTPSVTRSQGSSASSGGSSSSAPISRPPVRTTYDVGGNASWDIDVWGRIRRTVEADTASAQASAGDLAAAKLSAQATLVTSYFQLRVADELKRLLDASAAAYAQSLQITRNQYASGVASRADVVQAET
ncbi:MAG TPA: TolC family protein, partial [Magnetospirillum sp.]|nr:TolC family protein [Magnetospirillum sp.]